jgi:hypothetical protein
VIHKYARTLQSRTQNTQAKISQIKHLTYILSVITAANIVHFLETPINQSSKPNIKKKNKNPPALPILTGHWCFEVTILQKRI